MAKTKTKQEEGIELIENPDALASKAEDFFNDKKNQSLVFGIGGVLALIIVAFLGYRYYIGNQNNEAQQEMFQAVFYFEADSLGEALNGDGNNYGFLEIIDTYGGTDAANLANYYAGTSFLQLGDFENASKYLSQFSSNDYLIQARAYALTGDAYSELDDYVAAEAAYKKAADYKPNAEFTPIYLIKLAVNYEAQGKYKPAADAYGKIVSEYKNSSFFQDAQKHKARLDGLAAE
ncbi:MAG: tetratricopeptide (TPR) repeat protein [Cyclobacteriaceae bacterium]|jgi:tetratricopeptide (TPR) repeat protein